MKQIQRILISGLTNIILISIVLLFFKPLLNSGDDAFVMYSFSGAFGVEPTYLVDYNHGWHFILSMPIVQLFIAFPEFNWYVGFLLLLHFIAGTIICHSFFDKLKTGKVLFLFLIFFFFFEIFFLLALSFTNTSIILSIAGNMLLVIAFFNKKLSWQKLLFSLIILITAGLLRFHAWAFVEFFFIPFFLFFNRNQFLQYAALKFGLLVTLIVAFLVHEEQYKKNIPNWEKEEYTRQILYKLYNRPKLSKNKVPVFANVIERDFFSNGFFYDTTIFNDQKLEVIVNSLIRKRDFSEKEDIEILFWSFMEARVYLFLFFTTFIYLIVYKQKAVLKKTAFFLTLSFLLYVFLFVFRKITGYMFVSFFAINWLIILLLSINEKPTTPPEKYQPLIYFFIMLSIIWIGIRLNNINKVNMSKYSAWLCSFKDLKENFNTIHIASKNTLPIDYFLITDVPQKFAINNYISVSQMPKHVYNQKLLHFKIQNVTQDLMQRENFVIIGSMINSLPVYYKEKYFKAVALIEANSNYKCEKVYQLKEIQE